LLVGAEGPEVIEASIVRLSARILEMVADGCNATDASRFIEAG